jgi:hypothetical protein
MRIKAGKAASLAAAVLVLAACEDIDGLRAITGPADHAPAAMLTGDWAGQITSTTSPFPIVEGELRLTQVAGNITGELIINGVRAATFSAVLSGTRLTGTWAYRDLCGGSATFVADLAQHAARFTGTYTSTDCVGTVSGGFTFDRTS